jgi:hypothetical protein
VQADQLQWLRWLDRACPANGVGIRTDLAACLQQQYRLRKSQLSIERIGSALIYNRARFVWVAESPTGSASNNPIDPGFFDGTFTWPQIDEPTEAQSAWNATAESRLMRAASAVSSRGREKTAEAITASVGGEIATTADPLLLNNRLIATKFEIMTYSWGAVHPLTATVTYNWWLDRGRELQPEDVFRPDSGWQQKLATLAADRLKSQATLSPYLWKGAELDRGLQGVTNPTSWTITRSGLTVTFAQYQVAAYVAGMPEVHFTWKELQPLLEPTLNPATLPPASR